MQLPRGEQHSGSGAADGRQRLRAIRATSACGPRRRLTKVSLPSASTISTRRERGGSPCAGRQQVRSGRTPIAMSRSSQASGTGAAPSGTRRPSPRSSAGRRRAPAGRAARSSRDCRGRSRRTGSPAARTGPSACRSAGPAVLEHHDALAERHRFDLVVGDVDHGRAQLAMQARDLHAHAAAQLRVEVGQRLVEQEDLRVAHQRAAQRDALPLAAGERGGLAIEQRAEFERRARLRATRASISPRGTPRSFRPKPRFSRQSCADTARSSGTPSRCRDPSARRR